MSQRRASLIRSRARTPPDSSDPTLVGLYHERWEIETAFAEIKSTSLGGRVLRSRTPAGVAQEIYALAEVTFNLNSTAQLAEVLFNRLGLPRIKETRTRPSTDSVPTSPRCSQW